MQQLCFHNLKDKAVEAGGWYSSGMKSPQVAAPRGAAMVCMEDIAAISMMVQPLLGTFACMTGHSSSGASVQSYIHRSRRNEKEGISLSFLKHFALQTVLLAVLLFW